MAKDKHQDILGALDEMVEKVGVDGVLCRLTKVAVRQRDEADEGSNRAEQRYWQQMVEALSDFEEKVSKIEG